MFRRVLTIFIASLMVIGISIFLKNGAVITDLDKSGTASVIEIYHQNGKEYCVYEYASIEHGIWVAKDMFPNRKERDVGDIISIRYSSNNKDNVTEYYSDMKAGLIGILAVTVILGCTFIVKVIIFDK